MTEGEGEFFSRHPYFTVMTMPTYKLGFEHKEQCLQAEEYHAVKSMEYCAVKSIVQGFCLLSGFSERHFFAEHYGPGCI